MATTDANGVLFYETTDAVSPLQVLLNSGQTSISNALNARGKVYRSAAAVTPTGPLGGDQWFQTDTGLMLWYDSTVPKWRYLAGHATLAWASPSTGTGNASSWGWTVSSTINSSLTRNQSWIGTVSGENIVITEDGVYSVTANAAFAAGVGSGQNWYVNIDIGGASAARTPIGAIANSSASAHVTRFIAAGTTIAANTYQNSGGIVTRSSGLLTITRHS